MKRVGLVLLVLGFSLMGMLIFDSVFADASSGIGTAAVFSRSARDVPLLPEVAGYGAVSDAHRSVPTDEALTESLPGQLENAGGGLDEQVDLVPLENIPGVLKSLHGRTNSAELHARLVRKWAEADPSAAAAWVLKIPAGERADEGLRQVAFAWANSDLTRAAEWATSLPESKTRNTAVLAVGYEAARSEPLNAVELARSLASSPERDELLIHTVSQWAASEPGPAAEWGLQVQDRLLREKVLSAVLIAAATESPLGAAEFAVRQLQAGPEQHRAAIAVVQRWAQSSPEQAAGWVARFAPDETGRAAVDNLMMAWRSQDPLAAETWARNLADPKLKADALRTLQKQTDSEIKPRAALLTP